MLHSAQLVDPFEGVDDSRADGEWDVDGGYLGEVIAERTPTPREWRRPRLRSAAELSLTQSSGRSDATPSSSGRSGATPVDASESDATPVDASEPGAVSPESGPQSIEQLQSRIRQMQGTRLDTRDLPTHPAIASLLPGGGLKQGAAYSVERSATLLMALLAGPSAAGSWCGVVGVPEFGVEAAASYGIDLDRLVLVPHPGDQWLGVTAAIADVLTVVVTRPPRHASDGSVARLAARLRQRGSTLIVLGTWPQTEAMLSISRSRWSGIGDGFGHLASREVTVTVSSRTSGRPRSADLLLPDDLLRDRPVSQVPEVQPLPQQTPHPAPALQPASAFEEAMAG